MGAGKGNYVPVFLRSVETLVDLLRSMDRRPVTVVLVLVTRPVIVLVHVIGPLVALKLTILSRRVSLCKNLLIRYLGLPNLQATVLTVDFPIALTLLHSRSDLILHPVTSLETPRFEVRNACLRLLEILPR